MPRTSHISMTCALLALFSVMVPCRQLNADTIRLLRSADVTEAVVYLSDVALIESSDAAVQERLQSVTLGPAPVPGTSRLIELSEVTARLISHDIALASFELTGSSTVLVKRTPTPQSPQAPRVLYSPIQQPRVLYPFSPGRQEAPASSTSTTVIPSANTSRQPLKTPQAVDARDMREAEELVEQVVRRYLATAAPHWGNPIINPLPTSIQTFDILAMNPASFTIESGQPVSSDHFLITLAASDEDGTPARITVKTRITRRPKVLVTRRSISQGTMIQHTDVEWKEVDEDRDAAVALDDVIGKEAKRVLRAGERLRSEHVTAPKLIKRGDLVAVTAGSQLVRVRTTMKAKADGVAEDVVELITLDGKETLFARVSGVREATLMDTPTDNPPSLVQLPQ